MGQYSIWHSKNDSWLDALIVAKYLFKILCCVVSNTIVLYRSWLQWVSGWLWTPTTVTCLCCSWSIATDNLNTPNKRRATIAKQ